MAGSGAIRAGQAFVEIFADDSRLVRGLKAAQRRLQGFAIAVRGYGHALMRAGAAIAAPLLASSKVFGTMGADLVEMSQRTGIAVETLSELTYAAKQCGIEASALEGGLKRMARFVVDAAKGGGAAGDALRQLGLTVADLDGLSPDAMFALFAERLSKIEDPTIRAAAAMDVFGKSGTDLLPMMEDGAKGIEALIGNCRRLGLTIGTADARAGKKFSDTLTDLWATVKRGVFIIGASVAPALSAFAKWLTGIIRGVSDWINRNREVVATVLKVGAAVFAAGAGLVALSHAISAVSTATGGLVSVSGILRAVLGATASIMGEMLTPMGLVIAAYAALGGYILYTTGAAGKALQWLGGRFGELWQDCKTAFGAISNALAAGDIGLAVKVLWLTIKMEWTRGTGFLRKVWANLTGWLGEKWNTAWDGIRAVSELVWDGLVRGWYTICESIAKAWHSVTYGLLMAWYSVAAAVEKAWAWVKADSKAEVESENARIDAHYRAKADAARKEWESKWNATDAEYAKKRVERQAAHEAAMVRIGAESKARSDATPAETERAIAAAERDVAAARKEWEEAVAEANKKGAAARAAGEGPGKLASPDELIAKAKGAAGGLDELAKRDIRAFGSFSAAAWFGQAGGAGADRIAKGVDRVAKGVEGLRRDVQDGQAAFA